MPSRLFERLRERLLRAGIAPRHVRRYLGELRDHYDDALRSEVAKGQSHAVAEQTAWARLGSEERLAQSVLSRPELRSTLARRPVVVFGLGSLLIWIATTALVVIAHWVFPEASTSTGPGPSTAMSVTYGASVFYARVLPIMLIVSLLILSLRQRLVSPWPWIGTAVIALCYGTIDYSLVTAGRDPELTMSSSLLQLLVPIKGLFGSVDPARLAQGVIRAAGMFAMGGIPYAFLRRRHLLRMASD